MEEWLTEYHNFHNIYWWGTKSFSDDYIPNQKIVFMIKIQYLVFIRNDEIPTILDDNGYLYNKNHTQPIESLEGNYFSGFKVAPISFDCKKFGAIIPNAEVLVSLIPRTHIHNVITIKWIPLDLEGDPLEPLEGLQ